MLAFLITDSDTPLLMETVPALKLTEFSGTPARDNVYAYLRCYVHAGTMMLSAASFDGAPRATARFCVCMGFADAPQRYLCWAAAPSGEAALTLRDAKTDAVLDTLPCPAVHIVTGGDEQGLFWIAEGCVRADTFRQALGLVPRAGCVMTGNAFLCDTEEAAFGAAAPVPAGFAAPTAAGMDTWMVVPY